MILDFNKPKKEKSIEEWKSYSFDGGPAGGFVPNMSKEDVKKFRAQHIKGDNERIEIKVQMNGVNMVIVVFKQIYDVKYSSNGITEWRKRHRNIQISVNGKLDVSFEEYNNINEAINEAKNILGC